MARTLVASDDFNRASLGANWAQLNTFAATVQITTSTICTATAGSTGNAGAARWVGAGTFTDDQYAEVEIGGLAYISDDYFTGVCCRASSDQDGSRDHYWARVSANAGGPNYTTAFGKVVNGTVTTFHSASSAWANTDLLSLEVEGTAIRLCKNGTPLGGSFSTTDASLTTGLPGMYCANSIAYANAWAAGNMGSADVTVNLTGQSLTAAQGSVAAAISTALSGLSATVSRGTLASSISVGLTGQPSTVSAGTISRLDGTTLTGQSSTVSAGTIAASKSLGVSGHSASATAGSLVAGKGLAISGQSASVSAGTITADAQSYIVVVGTPDPTSAYRITATPDISSGDWIQYRGVGGGAPPTGLVILTDATWYFTVGNYPANFDVRVSDNGGTTWGSWATQSIGVWLSLTGQSVTASAGTIVAAISKALTGQSVAISQGTVSAGSNLTVALTGQSMSASQGAMAYSAALALVGAALAASQGSITANAGSNVTVNLTGQAMTAALGTLSPAKQATLTGQSASSAAGTLTVALARTLSGQSVPVSQGTVAVVRALTLLGIPCTVSQGAITAQAGGNVTVELTGIAIALTGGTMAPGIGALLAGAELSITSGFVGSNPQPPPSPSGPPNPIPSGGYASQNTPSVMLSTEDPATLRVGAGGCKLGRFAWADAGGLVGNQVELRLGFAVLQQQYWYSGYWAAGTFVLREGAPISLLSTGDVWAQFPAGAIPGDRVYARVLDGTAVSGYAAGCQATPWYVVTAAPAGGLAIISTTSRVQ